MKIKFLPLVCLIFVGAAAAFSQAVVVTPKKTVYKRTKPTDEYRKTFTINRPQVKAATPALSRKIEAAISYEKIFDLNLQEEISGAVQWFETADFEVIYNKNGILTVSLFIEGSGAYPSSDRKTVVVDLKTGNRIKAAAVFTNTEGLIAKIKQIQQEKIKANFEERKNDADFQEIREEIEDELTDADFKPENLEGFSVDDKGVTFSYDYGFRHAIRALEPDGEYFLGWAEIKPYLRPAGLLGKFIR